MFNDISYIMGMIHAGANGYLVKTSSKEEVIEAIRSISKNDFYYCNTISDKLYGHLVNIRHRGKSKKNEFSEQEIKVIRLICRQLSTKEISVKMNLATRTIEHYRQNIQEKIGARNVVGVALYALVHKLVKHSDLMVQ